MTQAETACPDAWGSHFLEYRGRLLALARRNLNPVLARRVSAEDVVQEALLAACGKMAFFENNPEIPVYFKLRTILFQTLTAMERKQKAEDGWSSTNPMYQISSREEISG